VIERCGGRIDSEYEHAASGERMRRYWIELGSESEVFETRC
jgi:predicted acetyltransferase